MMSFPSPRRMAVVVAALGLLAGACGDDGDVETIDVAAARDAFCVDAESLVETLDRYGMVLSDTGLTVGAARSNGEELAAARADVEASAETLQAALAAAEDAGEEIPDDLDVDDETIAFVGEAQQAFDDAIGGVDDDTPLVDAAVAVTSAAYQLEIAWIALLAEAGCLDDAEGFAQEVIAYVEAIQTDLTTAGLYDGPIDGIYGPATIAAVEDLQTAAGLPVTGLMDPATRQALAERLAGQESAHIAALQGLMVATGYYPGPVDGIANDSLDAAVRALQSDAGLEPTGIVDGPTLRAIQKAIAAAAPTTTTTDPATTSTGAASSTTAVPPGSGPDPTTAPSSTAAPSSTTAAPTSTSTAPPATTAGPDDTMLDVLESDERFSTLLTAVEAAGLDDELDGPDPLTLFAPTDEAFDALPDGALDDLLDPDRIDELTDLLSYHLAEGVFDADALAEEGTVETLLEDSSIAVTVDDTSVLLNTDQAEVETPDITASNGVIHAIDGVLTPD